MDIRGQLVEMMTLNTAIRTRTGKEPVPLRRAISTETSVNLTTGHHKTEHSDLYVEECPGNILISLYTSRDQTEPHPSA
jgi:hypothetical protein